MSQGHDELIDPLRKQRLKIRPVGNARVFPGPWTKVMARNNVLSTWITVQTPESWAREWTSATTSNSKLVFCEWAMGCKLDSTHYELGICLCTHPHSDMLLCHASSQQLTGLPRSWLICLEGASTVHTRPDSQGLSLLLYQQLPGMLGTCPQTLTLSFRISFIY